MNNRRLVGAAALVLVVCAFGAQAGAQVREQGGTTTFELPSQASDLGATVDFAGAKPLPLPQAQRYARPSRLRLSPLLMWGGPGVVPGGTGNGQESPVQLVAPVQPSTAPLAPAGGGVAPQEFGTANQPYTTSQVNAAGALTVSSYPFRAAGKLFFNIGSNTYLCSASLIKPGVVVTAGHCVANFGKSQFYSNWTFVPAYNNGAAPYGSWKAARATVLTSYYNGSDSCAQSGVICADDMALLTIQSQSGVYPGSHTGWFAYGWNGYSYNGSGQALISQLGYPVDLDGGVLMERNDSQSFVSSSLSNNTIIGSLMTGGSSGGPWMVNLGQPPSLSGVSFGTSASHEVVVGVTSWGYINTAVKQQGASAFTSSNIVTLVNTVCTATPGAC